MLETGTDFVIDRPDLELEFYIILARAYDGLKKTSKASRIPKQGKKIKRTEPVNTLKYLPAFILLISSCKSKNLL